MTAFDRLQSAIDGYLDNDSTDELINDLKQILDLEEDYHIKKVLACKDLRTNLFS